MAYQSTKPLANDKLSTSQGDIAGNFTEINTYVNVDHEAFNIANQGKHKKISLLSQAAAPAATAGEIRMGTAAMPGAIIPAVPAAITGGSEMFIARTDGVNNFSYPVTASLQATPGWCYLPSGLIMKWGNGVCPGAAVYVDGLNIPVFSVVLSAQVTFMEVAGGQRWACWMSGYNTTTVSTITDGAAKNFTYLIIGY
jgi:hypothetical protein